MMFVLWLALACDNSGGGVLQDAVAYQSALVDEVTFDGAFAACSNVTAPLARGDCQLGVIERFDRLEAADCQRLEGPTFGGECMFLLAERQAANGALSDAMNSCRKTHFRRRCWWHLLQDQAQASLEETPLEAERRIEPFIVQDRDGDNALQFWRIRIQEQASGGEGLNEAMCDELRTPAPCRQAVKDHVRQMLEVMSRTRLAQMCDAPAGTRIEISTGPAWLVGPLTTQGELDWETRRCQGR